MTMEEPSTNRDSVQKSADSNLIVGSQIENSNYDVEEEAVVMQDKSNYKGTEKSNKDPNNVKNLYKDSSKYYYQMETPEVKKKLKQRESKAMTNSVEEFTLRKSGFNKKKITFFF